MLPEGSMPLTVTFRGAACAVFPRHARHATAAISKRRRMPPFIAQISLRISILVLPPPIIRNRYSAPLSCRSRPNEYGARRRPPQGGINWRWIQVNYVLEDWGVYAHLSGQKN